MASFEIRWKRSAVKELRDLPKHEIVRIHAAVDGLSNEAFPAGSKKLVGGENAFRLRVGDYRVIYKVFGELLIIEVVRIGHRSWIYRR